MRQERSELEIANIAARHEEEFRKAPFYRGFGVGILRDGSLGIKVLVARKTQDAEDAIPRSVEGVEVEIDEVGDVTAY